RKDPPLDQTGGLKDKKKEVSMHQLALHLKKATEGAGRSTTGSQSRQMSTSESAFAEEPVQTTCQMEEPPHLVFETGADDQPIVQTSQHPEWFSQPRRPPSPDRAWNTTLPAAQGDAQSWISDLSMGMQLTGSLLEMYTPRGGSSLSLSSRLWNGTTTSIWIGFQYVVMMTRFTNLKKAILKDYDSKILKICCSSWYKGSYLI
nr:hypothetical protein [Tanacetum cinerariifolium]